MARGEIHIQLAVNFSEDPKVRSLTRFGRDARGCRDLYTQMLCYCKRNLTDGFVPVDEVGVLVYPDSPKIGIRDADRLVEVGLVQHTEGGYLLPGFLKRNKSKAQVEAESAAKAAAGRKGGKRSGQVRRGEAHTQMVPPDDEADANHLASPNEADAKQSASGCLNTETETETETITVPSEPCADAQGSAPSLFVVADEEPQAKNTRRSRAKKPDRSPLDDQADGLTNGYWDRYGKGNAQSWIAIRQVVLTALKNECTRNELSFALDAIGRDGKPITQNTLAFALAEVRQAQGLRPTGTTGSSFAPGTGARARTYSAEEIDAMDLEGRV